MSASRPTSSMTVEIWMDPAGRNVDSYEPSEAIHLLPSSPQAVAVALQRDDLGVVDQPVDHGRHGHGVPKISAQAENILFELTTSEDRSYREETRAKNSAAASGSNGM